MKQTMPSLTAVLALVALGAHPSPGLAQPGSRLNDNQVKETMKQVRGGLDHFVDKMNPQMRTAIFTSARGEVDVKAFLKDLRESADRMSERFNPPQYSANAEVLAFLRQARQLDDGIRRRPGTSGADPAWETMKPSLERLAGAYGIAWASDPNGWAALRNSDAEVKAAFKDLQRGTEGLRKEIERALKQDKSMDAAARATAIGPAAALAASAKEAASGFSSGREVGPLVPKMLESARGVESLLTARKLAGPVPSLWSGVSADLGKVTKAFGL